MQNDAPTWIPILAGDLYAEAMGAIDAIASAVVRPDVLPPHRASLSHGAAGAALFFAALSRAKPDARKGHAQTALAFLGRAVEKIGAQSLSPALYGGFTGIAWTVEYLQGRLFERDEKDDPNTAIDDALAQFVAQAPWRRPFDVIEGLAGLGVYALGRTRFPAGVAILRSIVERLDELAVIEPQGITWFTPPELLPPVQRKRDPHGHYNLGVAHGMPGVIAFLGEACAADVAVDTARPLLNGAVDWLLAQRNPGGAVSCFPAVRTGSGAAPHPARIAWCYGDLGISVALLGAARNVDEPSWEREAVRIARHAARRALEQSGVVDAGLCHGAAGNGHLFNRLYQATGEEVFLDAACFWFAHALTLHEPGSGVAGFRSWTAAENGGRWTDEPGLLEGAIGIGLALLAAVSDEAPDWDRMLLASIAPR